MVFQLGGPGHLAPPGCAYAMPPPPLGHGTKQKSAKFTLKSRNQILIKHAGGRGLIALPGILASF